MANVEWLRRGAAYWTNYRGRVVAVRKSDGKYIARIFNSDGKRLAIETRLDLATAKTAALAAIDDMLAELPSLESTERPTAKSAFELWEAKLARARELYVIAATLHASARLWDMTSQHGVLSKQAKDAKEVLDIVSGEAGKTFDENMAAVEASERSRHALVAVQKGRR